METENSSPRNQPASPSSKHHQAFKRAPVKSSEQLELEKAEEAKRHIRKLKDENSKNRLKAREEKMEEERRRKEQEQKEKEEKEEKPVRQPLANRTAGVAAVARVMRGAAVRSTRREQHVDRLANQNHSGQGYVPLAEQVAQFTKEVSRRARSASPAPRLKPTKPESPKLLSAQRSRPSTAKSFEQQQEELAEQMKHQQFKATKLDPRVLSSAGALGVRKPEKPAPTQVEEFHFTEIKARPPPLDLTPAPFKAQPIPDTLYRPPTPSFASRAPTTPISPDLHTKARAQQRPSTAPSSPKAEFKAQEMPDFSKLHFKVVHERRSTEPQPFNLLTEERGQVFEEYREQWKQQWEEIEKIQREFIANPAPPPPRAVSRPRTASFTEPQPFHLRSLELHEQAKQEFEAKVQQELEEEQQARTIKARAIVRVDHPDMIRKSEKPATTPEGPQLVSELRAKERAEFDAMMKEKIAAEEAAKKERELEEQQLEEEERQEARRKAKPDLSITADYRKAHPHLFSRSNSRPGSASEADREADRPYEEEYYEQADQ